MITLSTSLWLLEYSFRHYMIPIFTESREIIELGLQLLPITFTMVMFDFIQGVLCGFIKCLNLQKRAIGVNFVTYYVIIAPMAYLLGFK